MDLIGGVFGGGFRKNGRFLWFFDGQGVVKCVVNVVCGHVLMGEKNTARTAALFSASCGDAPGERLAELKG